MIPLYRDRQFQFLFAESRVVPRFHLEGVGGRAVRVYRLDPATGERLGLLATAAADAGGWVALAEPLVVRAGEGFVAVPLDPGA